MKAVMISIKPKWVERIASGEKTIEVRKTVPKLETPFKCFIYETKEKHGLYVLFGTTIRVDGKVIGEFVCDKVYEIKNCGSQFLIDKDIALTNKVAKESCLDFDDMLNYLKTKDGYGLHISNLKIYDKPKEISEFNGYCEYRGMTNECLREDGEFCSYSYEYITVVHHIKCEKVLTRPPQSWCYVEK